MAPAKFIQVCQLPLFFFFLFATTHAISLCPKKFKIKIRIRNIYKFKWQDNCVCCLASIKQGFVPIAAITNWGPA